MARLLLFLDLLLRAVLNLGLLLLFGWIGSNVEWWWTRLESVATKHAGDVAREVSEIAFFVALLAVAVSTLSVRTVRKYMRMSGMNLVWLPLNQWLAVGKIPSMHVLCVELYKLTRLRIELLRKRFRIQQPERAVGFRHEGPDRASPRDRNDSSGEPLHSGNPTIFMGLIAFILGGFLVVGIYNLIIVPIMNIIVLPILRVIAIVIGIAWMVICFIGRVISALSILSLTVAWMAWESVLGRVMLVLAGRLPIMRSVDGQEVHATLSTPLWAALAARLSRHLFAVSGIVLVVCFADISTGILGGVQAVNEMDRWDKWAVLGVCGYLATCLTIALLVALLEGCWWSVKTLQRLLPHHGEKLD